jgi:Flp pilus assembly protein TadD, contains TPR repeats
MQQERERQQAWQERQRVQNMLTANYWGNLAYKQGHYRDAVQWYREALRDYPNDQTLLNNLRHAQEALTAQQRRQQAYAQNQNGLQHFLSGEYHVAQAAFQSAAENDPNDATIAHNLRSVTSLVERLNDVFWGDHHWDLHSGFDVAKHGWATRNMANSALDTWDGVCYGMARLAQVAYTQEVSPDEALYRLTATMEGAERQLYTLKSQAETAREAAKRFARAPAGTPDTFEGIRREIALSKKPQVLVLKSSREGGGHTLVLTGYHEDGESIVFDVYDPNTPYHEDPKVRRKVAFIYDKRASAYHIYRGNSSGALSLVYQKWDVPIHDRDEVQQEVIRRLTRLIGKMQDAK